MYLALCLKLPVKTAVLSGQRLNRAESTRSLAEHRVIRIVFIYYLHQNMLKVDLCLSLAFFLSLRLHIYTLHFFSVFFLQRMKKFNGIRKWNVFYILFLFAVVKQCLRFVVIFFFLKGILTFFFFFFFTEFISDSQKRSKEVKPSTFSLRETKD